jgi:hypothetical protein
MTFLVADDEVLLARGDALFQHADLAAERLLLQRAGDAQQEVLLVVRLRDQVVGSLADQVEPALDRPERRQKDHRRRGMECD